MTLLSNGSRNASLDNDYGATRAPGAPTSHEFCLFAGDPSIPEADGGGVELGPDGGYQRVTIPNDATWSPAENGAKVGPLCTLPISTGAWSDTATHWALLGSDGNWWDTGVLAEPVTVSQAGVTISGRPVVLDPSESNLVAPAAPLPPEPTVVTFAYTGAAQSWVVPTGVTSVTLECWGAQGGSSNGTVQGGKGGYATGTLAVTPGETLSIYVGGRGASGSSGAGGGGATDVRQGGTALGNRRVVAGAGGGTGNVVASGAGGAGGAGGGTSGSPGVTTGATSRHGAGGTQAAGGASGGGSSAEGALGSGGSGADTVTAETGGYNGGGDGGTNAIATTAGGGGGYYGGGGATYGTDGASIGGGGGGSSYIGGVTAGSTSSNVREGDGLATITYAAP